MLARLKGPFDGVPQLAYSKMSMKRLFIEKGPSKNFEERVLGIEILSKMVFKKKLERNKS